MFIRSNISMSTFSKICFPLMSIPFLMLLFVFLYDATAFLRSLTLSSFNSRYMLDDLSSKVKVLSDWLIVFMSSFSWFCSWFFTFRDFKFFTNSFNSHSRAASSFTVVCISKLSNPYFCCLLLSFLVSWKIYFHFIRLITISISSINL